MDIIEISAQDNLMGNPKLVWAKVIPGQAPEFGEVDFDGTLEQATQEMRSRAARGEFTFGQVLRADGFVLLNLAGVLPSEAAAAC